MELDRCGVCGHRLNEEESTKELCPSCKAVRTSRDRNASKVKRITERLKALSVDHQALSKSADPFVAKTSSSIEAKIKEAIKMLEE